MTCVWRSIAFTLESALVLLVATSPVWADESKPTTDAPKGRVLSAHQAVRLGNEHLIAGQPDQALEAYRQAKELEPQAREIGFVEGLAYFDLGEYEPAREAFRKAAGVEHDDLSADALYSLAATDHAESLASMEGAPQEALSQLESAMRRYHEVLNQRPDHRAAREANRRAASMWRKLKRQLQQQEQQNQDQNQNEQDEDQEEQDQQNQGGEQQDQEQNDQQDQQESESSDQSEDQQQQPAQSEKQEQVSREQAERRLREMMQAVRERKKERREQTRKVRLAPVEKDW